MKRLSFVVVSALMAAFSVSAAEPAETPISRFLKAADEGRMSDLAPLVSSKGLSASKFIKKTENCYLRRVYSNPAGEIIAAWMCDEGKNKSRVVIAELFTAQDGVAIVIGREVTNNIAAPARTESAFADEKTDG